MSAVAIAFLLTSGSDSASAQVQVFSNSPSTQITTHAVRSKAAPDECFAFLANPSPLPKFTDPTRCASYPVPTGMEPAKPKVNQSYIWGLTESGDSLWWGTFANANCVTQAGSVPATGNPNGAPNAHLTASWVCEYYDSPYYPSPIADARIGDFRPPRAYQYSKTTRTTVDKTPRYPVFVTPNNPEGIQLNLYTTRGIRSALSINGLIILAGPSLDPTRGLNVFAWDANTGAFLGARPLSGYNNIRQFLVVNGVAYTAVGKNQCSDGACTPTIIGGRILRMEPTIVPGCTYSPAPGNPTPPPCFLLNGGTQIAPAPPTEVGSLDTVAGALTLHNGRIYTVTWPSSDLPGVVSSLYQSPIVPAGGLTAADSATWTQRWKASDYEPDPNMAQFYAGGALASFDGYLWWGTLHIPMQPTLLLVKTYPPNSAQEALQDLAGTFRATVFFRGKDLDTINPQIDLMYGNEKLPVFTPPANGLPQSWALQTNKMKNPKAMWGSSGFGNPWNTYTWTASVWDGRLWVGTMDWSFNAQQGATLVSALGMPVPTELFTAATYGGDLFYFTSASKPAFPESTDGIDNPTSFGIRNQLPSANGNLFLGMANVASLATDPNDPKHLGGLGGWELIELARSPNVNTPVGANVDVTMANGVTIKYCSVTKAGQSFSSTVRNPFSMPLPVHPLFSPSNLPGPPLPLNVANPPPQVILLWSSALWGQGCTSPTLAQVSTTFGGDIPIPRMLQLQWNGSGYIWSDITLDVNYATRKVTGAVTSDYIGVLGLAQLAPPTLTAAINMKGQDQRVSSFFVDLTLTNTGKGTAKNISIDTLTLRTLNGNGTVTYNSPPGAPLPLTAPVVDLAPGASTTIRIYLKSSTTFGITGVWRFSIAAGVKMTDLIGTPLSVTLTQTVLQ
jgi:hypothetical protein